MMPQFRARHYRTLLPVDVTIEDDLIADICEADCSDQEAANLPYVSPGLFDIQINGYNGIWFSSPALTTDQVVAVTQSLVNKSVARYFPTLITNSFEALHHGFSTLRQACEQSSLVNDCVAGYHLEGPYISTEDGPRGAHPLQHVRPADYDEFQKLQTASGDRIRLVTLAAEADNAVPFIQQCTADGVVVAVGHSAADTDQIGAAVEAGARLSTHLGNGAHATLPRHPNYLWDQLADDNLWASIIADGWHLPDSVLKCVLRCKSMSRTILTCDVSGFGGCPSGTYAEGDVGVEVLDDGRIVVAGQRQFLAGSGAITGDCIVHMIDACGVSLFDAVRMASVNPAILFDEPLPDLEVGAIATLSLFRLWKSQPESKLQSDNGGSSTFLPIDTFVCGKSRWAPPATDS
ncbi:MAG: amidohydrolase family protein [Fuerstiella sp.]|nr:amidohydrolase family protein [Fuerstiella sp.]MCP4855089.1 amidohydrolase family protein [Fuerstiella sp.]